MKSKHFVLLGALAVAITSIQGWENKSEEISKFPAPDETIGERHIASVSDISAGDVAGIIFAPRITAVRNIKKATEEIEQKNQEIQELKEELEVQISENQENTSKVQDLQEQIEKLEKNREDLSLLAGETIVELEKEKEKLKSSKEELQSKLKNQGIEKEEVQDQLTQVEKEFSKAENQISKLNEKLKKAKEENKAQKEMFVELEKQYCLQKDRISNLESQMEQQLKDKEQALAKLKEENASKKKSEKNKKEKEEDEINISELVDAFKNMIASQINFQQQYQGIEQLHSSPTNLGFDYSQFLNQTLWQNQSQQMMVPFGGYSMQSPQYMQQAQQQNFGAPFLDQKNAHSLQSYYAPQVPSAPQEQFVNQQQPGFQNITQTAPQARYHLFNNLERNPATLGAQGAQTNFFGGQAQNSPQRAAQDVESFYTGGAQQ